MLSFLRRHYWRVLGAAALAAAALWLLRRRRGARPHRKISAGPPSASVEHFEHHDAQDLDELSGMFERAAHVVSSGALGSQADATMLRFYALYKQSTSGPAPTTATASLLDLAGHAKWSAWSALGTMDANNAKRAYVELLDTVAGPGWRQSPSHSPRSSRAAPDSPAARMVASSPAQQSWNRVSTMVEQVATPVAEAQQDFIYHCREGNSERALQMVQRNPSVLLERDADGASGLLWAIDRGNAELVMELLREGADVETADNEGSTALHYACMSGHADVVKLLLHAGARTDVADHDGMKPGDLTEDPDILAMLVEASKTDK